MPCLQKVWTRGSQLLVQDSTYTTAAVGSGTTGQTQHYSMDHPANDHQLPSCLEINYHSTTNMDSVFQVPTCKLHLRQEQLLQALHPTSLLQDLYYMISEAKGP